MFVKVEWGFNKMNYVEAGGTDNRVGKDKLEDYMNLACSDPRIVAFSMHPDEIMATFLTYLRGYASPSSHSWPVYVRKDLNQPTWRVGSTVDIGDPDVRATSPTGLY